jgi:hypothetical protein
MRMRAVLVVAEEQNGGMRAKVPAGLLLCTAALGMLLHPA